MRRRCRGIYDDRFGALDWWRLNASTFSSDFLLLAVPRGARLVIETPMAAPGLRIPGTAIPYALDEYKGKLELVPIHHSTITVNRHIK